jgi:hypothetical protein
MDNLSDTVNTEFVLDMQRKLYRWSAADPNKRFADLFNIVCDRRTMLRAWERLARNRGSNTPGTDRVTRKVVEERPPMVSQGFWRTSGNNCDKESTGLNLSGKGSSRSRRGRRSRVRKSTWKRSPRSLPRRFTTAAPPSSRVTFLTLQRRLATIAIPSLKR